MTHELILGSALDVLHAEMPPASVAMVYADPPFGTMQTWSGTAGAFDDRWTDQSVGSADGWDRLRAHSGAGCEMVRCTAMTETQRGYLGFMASLLLGVRRVLCATGTLWLHFDDTMGAHLRILCDVVFGPRNALGLVIWRRSSAHTTSKCFGRVHDTIACYGRSAAAAWRLWRIGSAFVAGDPLNGERIEVGGLLEDRLNASSNERVGYPTQKPVSLMTRFVGAATLPGELVLDPTCGSGSTVIAAARCGRRSVGIDVNADAIICARARLDAETAQGALFERAPPITCGAPAKTAVRTPKPPAYSLDLFGATA